MAAIASLAEGWRGGQISRSESAAASWIGKATMCVCVWEGGDGGDQSRVTQQKISLNSTSCTSLVPVAWVRGYSCTDLP